MMKRNVDRIKSGFTGAGVCAFFCSVAYSLSAIIFSELKSSQGAVIATLILSALSASTYLLLEKTVYLKSGSSSFAIGYFGTLAIISALVFFITSIFPLDYIFDTAAYYTAVYLRQSMMLLCTANAAALIIRLGFETHKYIEDVLNPKD